MPNGRYPGAIWRPVQDKGAMSAVRGFGFHIAVTRAEQSIFGWVESTSACQLYVGRYGYCEQYIEVGRIAYGMKDGNSSMVTVESWDGLDRTEKTVDGLGPNDSEWDAGQQLRFADIAAWANREWGVPIQMMQSSKKSERGFAPHRWGIEPWRTQRGGGEVWTNHNGKTCPGDKRIAQMPGILARARVLASRESYNPIPPGKVDPATEVASSSVPVLIQPPATAVELEEEMGPLIIAIDQQGVIWRTRDFITKSWIGPGTEVLEAVLWLEKKAGRTPKLWTNIQNNELVDFNNISQLDTAGRIKANDPAFGQTVGLIPREPEREDT